MTERQAATQTCPHCYTAIDARATVCPQCGRDIKPKTPKNKKPLWKIGTFIMAFGLVGLIAGICGFIAVGDAANQEFCGLGATLGLIALGVGAIFRVIA